MSKLTAKLPFSKKSKTSKITFASLKKYNLVAAGLHFIQGVLVLVLADPNKGIQPVTTNYLTTDTLATEATGSPVLVQGSTLLFDVNLAYLVAAFFFMSAIAHVVVAFWYRIVGHDGLQRNQPMA